MTVATRVARVSQSICCSPVIIALPVGLLSLIRLQDLRAVTRPPIMIDDFRARCCNGSYSAEAKEAALIGFLASSAPGLVSTPTWALLRTLGLGPGEPTASDEDIVVTIE